MKEFETDIRAQGKILRDIASWYWNSPRSELDTIVRYAADGGPIVLTGMGSSLAAAEFIVPILRAAGRQAMAVDASELTRDIWAAFSPSSVVVAISQTGRSRETLAAASSALDAGLSRLVVIVNDLGSPLAALGSCHLRMLAGEERLAAAKSFTATQLILCWLAHAIAGPVSAPSTGHSAVARVVDAVEQVLARPRDSDAAAELLRTSPYLALLSRGSGLSSARYGALLLKESAAFPSEATTSADFLHGPIELTTLPIGVVLMSLDPAFEDADRTLLAKLEARGAPTWVLTTGRSPAANGRTVVTQLPDLPPALAAIACAVQLQMLAAAAAKLRGREPGVFTVFRRTDTAPIS